MKQYRLLAIFFAMMFLFHEPSLYAQKRYKSSSKSSSSYKSSSFSSSKYSSGSRKSYGSFYNRKVTTPKSNCSSSSRYSSSNCSKSSTSRSSSSSSSNSRATNTNANTTSPSNSRYSSSTSNTRSTTSTRPTINTRPTTNTRSTTNTRPTTNTRSTTSTNKNVTSTSNSRYSSANRAVGTARSTSFRNGRPVTGSKADQGLSRTQRVSQAKSSRKSYTSTSKKFKKTSTFKSSKTSFSNKTQRTSFNRVTSRRGYNPRDYHYRRGLYLGGYHPPGYIYSSMAPRWGMWDTVALMFIIQQGSRAQQRMFYDNRSDPQILAFRQELNQLSRDNQELRQQMRELERNESQWKNDGVPPEPGRIPEDIGDLAFSPEMIDTLKPIPGVLNLATGGKNGLYYQFGKSLAQCIQRENANLQVNLLETAGTRQNVRGISNGDYDAAVIQADGLDEYYLQNPDRTLPSVQATLYKEKVFIIVRDDSDIDSIKDIHGEQKQVMMVFKKGSGAELTFRNLGREDSGYQKFRTRDLGGTAALKFVSSQKRYKGLEPAMVVVIGMNSNLLRIADSLYPNLKIVPYDDWDANDYTDRDGNDVYSTANIPAVYDSLQPKGFFGGTKEIKSVEVESVFFLSDDWVQNNSDSFDEISLCGVEAKQHIVSLVQTKS